MSDDWADEPDLPEHVPPKDDRLWAHPSEYRGPHDSNKHRTAAIFAAMGLVLVGLVIAKTTWPTTKIDTRTNAPASSLSIGTTTSNHIENLAKALVTIIIQGKQPITIYGLAISPNGYILAPANVIGSAKKFTASMIDTTPSPATLIAVDQATDTAVLKVPEHLSHYVSGTSQRTAKPGEMTIGIGPNSRASKPNLVISQIQQSGLEQILSTGQTADNTYIADPAEKFNPEGLLFVDSQGNPLGLGLGTISNKWVIAPLSTMLSAAQKIELSNGAPQGWLGIVGTSASSPPPQGAPGSTPGTPQISAPNVTANKGVIVYSVVANSPAQKAGVQPKDIIVGLDNEPISGLPQLQSMLTQFPSGSQVTLTIFRNGQTSNITIQLGVKSTG
ncbi:MAG: S1C family serine protease [Actinomycetota bacterium]|nr:S1C family serine protease [Actinomycetota bacterium]